MTSTSIASTTEPPLEKQHSMFLQTSPRIFWPLTKAEEHNLPLYPSGLFVEQAQKSIRLFISEMTSGAQRALLWNKTKQRESNLPTVKSPRRKKTTGLYLPAELIRVLVVISMKINQKKSEFPLGITKCLWETKEHNSLLRSKLLFRLRVQMKVTIDQH